MLTACTLPNIVTNPVSVQLTQEQIDRYQQWEKTSQNDLPGRYSMGFQGAPVFSIYDRDTPTALNEIEFRQHKESLERLCDASQPASNITVSGINAIDLDQLLNTFNGQISFTEACSKLPTTQTQEQLRQHCQALLGQAVFLTDAIQALELRIRRAEIVRFPVQSPYLILREYWSNCADVRGAIPLFMDNLQSLAAFKSSLADLHIFATMGCDLKTYYAGSGGVPTIPGGYRTHPMRTGLAPDKAHFIDAYLHEIGLEKLCREDRFVFSKNKVLLGLTAEEGRIFRHPPPENGGLDQILDEMRIALSEVAAAPENSNEQNILEPLSRFHKLFLHAHPFYNINNSVAMNIVNFHLLRTGSKLIPHLLLDFIALRADFDAYAKVFATAVKDYGLSNKAGEEEEVLGRIANYHGALQSLTENDEST